MTTEKQSKKTIEAKPPRKKAPSRGGARKNSGRPAGTSNKISGVTILASVEKYSGERFEDLLAQGYVESIESGDKPTRLQYEKMFLNKVVADRAEIDHTSGGERIQAAFSFIAAELPDYAKK